jgi:hypothetical protein
MKTQVLLDASKEVGLEVNPEKPKYVFMYHYQKAVQNHNLIMANKLLKMWRSSNILE